MDNPTVFVVQSMGFSWKLSNCDMVCEGVFRKWEDAVRAVMPKPTCGYCGECIASKEFYLEDGDGDVVCQPCVDASEKIGEDTEGMVLKNIDDMPVSKASIESLLDNDGCMWSFDEGEGAQWCADAETMIVISTMRVV